MFSLLIRKPDTNTYRLAVCRLASKLGDLLCAGSIRKSNLPRNGRRKSWLGDKIWSQHYWGFYLHQKLQHFILYGNFSKGYNRWSTNGETYRF